MCNTWQAAQTPAKPQTVKCASLSQPLSEGRHPIPPNPIRLNPGLAQLLLHTPSFPGASIVHIAISSSLTWPPMPTLHAGMTPLPLCPLAKALLPPPISTTWCTMHTHRALLPPHTSTSMPNSMRLRVGMFQASGWWMLLTARKPYRLPSSARRNTLLLGMTLRFTRPSRCT